MGRTGSGLVALTCMGPGCGRRFARYPSQIAPSGRVYCSHACADAAMPVRYRRPTGPPVAREQSGPGRAGRAVPAIALPRLARRRHDRLAEAAARGWRLAALLGTPRPGEGRAPTTAG